MTQRLAWAGVVLIWAAWSAMPQAASFRTEPERAGFLKALAEADKKYDPRERMVRRPFSSPGYHTTLKGGFVHPTRESLGYAVALLDSGEPERLARAQDILRRVIALQDQNPESKTYGIWSWFLEEPLAKMSPPDWNWADFNGTQLLQVALDHMDRLPADLREMVRESIRHACASIRKRDVKPGYTNIALMGTYVTLAAGERFDWPEFRDYGMMRLKRFCDFTKEQGSFSEYNSPTYTVVAIEEITRMMQHVREPEARQMIGELNRFAWTHAARRFHAPTRQWAGPHSRCYSTLVREGTLAFIQRATGGKAAFLPEAQAFEDLDAVRLRPQCPDDLVHYFTELREPRVEKETFIKGGEKGKPTIGTTYLTPEFALGTVNLGDFWNQRRSVIAYFKNGDRTVSLRVRVLHDGYDYASARFFSVQDGGDVLGAVAFATDGGDTHPSLDRVKDGTIRAKDLRLRFELESDGELTTLPAQLTGFNPGVARFPFILGGTSVRLELGNSSCFIEVPYARGFRPTPEAGRTSDTVWYDIVFYQGPERDLNFSKFDTALAFFIIRIRSRSEQRDLRSSHGFGVVGDRLCLEMIRLPDQENLELRIPMKPAKGSDLIAGASGTIGDQDAWVEPARK